MNARFAGLLRKEVLQFTRDRVVLFLILYLYTIEVVMCALALAFEVRDLPFAVVDQDRSVASRHLVELFRRNEAFALTREADSTAPAGRWLQQGEVGMVIVIPTGFGQYYATGTRPSLQVLLDGTNSNVAENVRHYAAQVVRRFERERPPLAPPAATSGTATPVVRLWYNPAQITRSFMVLSMIALAGMMVGTIYSAASIVREKERGTLEQLLVTPIGVGELFVAKTLPTIAINLLAVFPALLIVAAFDVPLRGNLLTFLAMTASFQLSAVAFGVWIATVTRTLQQALLLSFFALFPIMFLSGSLTPMESMPPFLQALSYLSPLRYFMDIILGVFLKGAGWAELWPQALALLAMGTVLFASAAVAFRRRIV